MKVLKTLVPRILAFLPTILIVALFVWLLGGSMSTRQQLKLENLKGQLTARTRMEPQIARAAAELRAQADARIREADLRALKENALRVRAEQEREQWQEKAAAADRRVLEEQRRHETQVAEIPSLEDAKLAELTTHQLKSLYTGAPLFAPRPPDFTVNRNGLELTLRAGLEVESLRFIRDRQAEQIDATEHQAQALTDQRDSTARELASERSARTALEASAAADKNHLANLAARLDTYERMEATRKSATRWGKVKRIAVVGALAGAGALTGDRAGYGFAAGAVAVSLVDSIF